jgi:hypothetical protein
LTTFPVPGFDPETAGFQFAVLATALRTAIHRPTPFVWLASMFWIRNAIGSIPAACASASIVCSEANVACGAPGARSQIPLKNPS